MMHRTPLRACRSRWTMSVAALALCSAGVLSAQAQPGTDEARCEALRSWSIPQVKVTAAEYVPHGGTFSKQASPAPATTTTSKPFCRVQLTVTPEPGAEIGVELWLPPAADWNGKFLGTGNGAAAGAIVYKRLVEGIEYGYAVANTDVGTHSGGLGYAQPDGFKFGIENMGLRINYVWRGIHLMTTSGKAVTRAYYQKPAKANLFAGCSSGGYEAMGESQRFPEDYDGILAGDPGVHFAANSLWQGWSYQLNHKTPGALFTADQLPALHRAVMDQCDQLDGLKDNIVTHPDQCHFDPAALACKPGQAAAECLTPGQVETIRSLYRGLYNPTTGQLIYPGFPAGSELAGGARVRLASELVGSMNNPKMPGQLVWVLGNDWNADKWIDFDFDKGATRAIRNFAPWANDNPDLSTFAKRGGKIVFYSGAGDPNLFAEDLVHYVEDMQKEVGGPSKAASFSRLFLVPGMEHCRGGDGPNFFGQENVSVDHKPEDDILLALDRWVTEGKAPERIVATKYQDNDPEKKVERTRPLCAWPQEAIYKGSGSIDEAANFTCGIKKNKNKK